MVPRFHAPGLPPGAATATLDEGEAHHLVHVLRLRRGDTARVFDGAGREWEGIVAAADRRHARIEDLHPIPPLAEPGVRLTALVSIVRGAAMDVVVRDLTMLGAGEVRPVYTERTSVTRRASDGDALLERWRRIAVTACKQCGRATLPAVAPPLMLDEALASASRGVRLLLVEPTLIADGLTRLEPLAEQARHEGATLAIGPEGGWTATEVSRARAAGFVPWSLGSQILRAESVPVAALSVLRYAWNA